MSAGDTNPILESIIADYFRALESGDAPDREELIGQHPDLADDLTSFFANHDQMKQAAGSEDATLQPGQLAAAAHDQNATLPPTRNTDEDATIPPGSAQAMSDTEMGTNVRYFGDYELLDEIARGGMGVVYKARQVNLNRIVALKMILAGQLAGDEDVRRFHAEAEAAANLDHPGIVPIFEIGEHEGQHYFSMGFVEGMSLADKIKDGPLPAREAAEYAKKVAEAMAFAHERGVIHRDLKPANVLLDQNDEPKVTDFGLAKRVEGDSGLTATGQILGTPSYMPPEQASGKIDEITERADVYSLGGILYALLTARPPFQADNHLDTLLQVLEAEAVSPRTLNPNVPVDLETICLKCLEKEPNQRYDSAKDLATELQRFLNHEPIVARPISSPARAWRWCKRKPVVAGLLAAVTASLLAGFGISTYFAIIASNQVKRADAKASEALLEKRRADEEAEAAYAATYAARINLLGREAEAGKTFEAERQLIRLQREFTSNDDQQGIEWHFWQAFCDYSATRLVQQPHTLGSLMNEIAISPDGSRVAYVFDGKLELCDVVSKRTIKTLFRTNAHLQALTFTVEGKHLFALEPSDQTQGEELKCTVRSWNIDTGTPVISRELRDFHESLNGRMADSFAISSDGRYVAAKSIGEVGEVVVWSLRDDQPPIKLKGGFGYRPQLVFSPDSTRLAAVGMNLTVWDLLEEEQVFEKSPARSAAFSPDGRSMAVFADGGLVVLDPATSREELLFKNDSTSSSQSPSWMAAPPLVAYSPSGDSILCVEDNAITMWNVDSKRMLRLPYSPTSARDVQFFPDGRRIAIVDAEGLLFLRWNAKNSTSVNWQTQPGFLPAIALSPDGQRLALYGHGMGELYAVSTRMPSLGFSSEFGMVIQLSTGRTLLETPVRSGREERPRAVAFDQNVKRAAMIFKESAVVTDIETKAELFRVVDQFSSKMALSPGGKYLATMTESQLDVWGVDSQARVCSMPLYGSAGILQIRFSQDASRLAVLGREGTTKVWEIGPDVKTVYEQSSSQSVVMFDSRLSKMTSLRGEQGIAVTDLDSGVEQQIDSRALMWMSADGNYIVTGTSAGAALWEVATGRQISTLGNIAGKLIAVTVSPDRKSWCAITFDGGLKVKVVSVRNGEELLSLKLGDVFGTAIPNNALTPAFTSDGSFFAAIGTDGVPIVWDIRPRTAEVAVDRERRDLVRFLFSRPLAREHVVEAIQADKSVSDQVKSQAILLAADYPVVSDPASFYRSAWRVCLTPHANDIQRRFALWQARHACTFGPHDKRFQIALGLAQYRNSQFDDAMQSLIAIGDTDPGPGPTVEACLALVYLEMGQATRAEAILMSLRDLGGTEKEIDADALTLLDEVRRKMGLATPLPPER